MQEGNTIFVGSNSVLQGRSPYDDVVPGEGVPDLRAPQQMYDERGRPVNPETRRINRDLIRSHNEIMHVIGVAEPENVEPLAEIARKHDQYEEQIGQRLLRASSILRDISCWIVDGLRQRVMVGPDANPLPPSCTLDTDRLLRSTSTMPTFHSMTCSGSTGPSSQPPRTSSPGSRLMWLARSCINQASSTARRCSHRG